YFKTMGIPLLYGRDFTDADATGSPLVTIIDERLAHKYWPNEIPLGKRVRFGPPEDNEPWHIVIGVVRAVRHQRMQEDTAESVYLPYLQIPISGMAVVLRTSSDPTNLVPAFRSAVTGLDTDIPISEVAPMEKVIAESIWQPRLYAALFAVFAAGA